MEKNKIIELAESIAEKEAKKILGEEKVIITTPKPYVQKTEMLSSATKASHDQLYRKYIEDFNKVQMQLQAAPHGTNYLQLRELYKNRVYLLNAIKLHELYFSNISDLSSQITVNSIAYTKITEAYGSFNDWQEGFIDCCMVAREGWGVLYYDPYLKTLMNGVIDLHDEGLPAGSIPLIVMDMWSHAYFHDYGTDKKAYVYAMMKELNWTVIEARFESINPAQLNSVFAVKPMIDPNATNLVEPPTSVDLSQVPIHPKTINSGIGPLTTQPSSSMFESKIEELQSNLGKIIRS